MNNNNNDNLLHQNDVHIPHTQEYENENEYEVKCKIVEDFKPLIDIRLSVGSREDARSICANWKNHAKEIYPQVIGVLLGKENE